MTSQFVSELIVAANEIHHVTLYERRRLLGRSAAAIRDMCEQIWIDQRPPTMYPINIEFSLRAMVRNVERHSDEKVSRSLLDAAGALNDLRKMIDAIGEK